MRPSLCRILAKNVPNWLKNIKLKTNFSINFGFPIFALRKVRKISTKKNQNVCQPASRRPYFLFLIALLNESPRRLGCFLSEPSRPLLSLVLYNDTQLNSPDHCVRTCRWAGLSFAGLTNGSLCYCDRKMPIITLPSTRCQEKQCPGDPLATCGGAEAIEVYATGAFEQPIKVLGKLGLFSVHLTAIYMFGCFL